MTVDERKNISTGVIQNLILENRGKLSISGVNDVLCFDTSEVIVEGDISYLAYSDKEMEKNKSSIISKIFK